MFDIAASGVPSSLAVPFGLVENAHRRLARRIGEMSQAELEYLGTGGNRNSTATLAAHIALTDFCYLLCIKGEEVVDEPHPILGAYEDEQGNLPAVTGVSAADLIARHAMVIGQIREYLQSCNEAEAERAVKVAWWPEEATVRYVLWHMASHTVHHIGQIVRLQEQYKQG